MGMGVFSKREIVMFFASYASVLAILIGNAIACKKLIMGILYANMVLG